MKVRVAESSFDERSWVQLVVEYRVLEHGLTVGRRILVPDGLGSNPSAPAYGDIAQLEEHLDGIEKVMGSSPIVSTEVR